MEEPVSFKKDSHTVAVGDTPNYITIGLDYLEAPIYPMLEKWKKWGRIRRAIVASIASFFLPSFITMAFFLPSILFLLAIGYIYLFGWYTTRRHLRETFQGRRKDLKLIEDVIKNVMVFKFPGNFGLKILLYCIDSFAVIISYSLSLLLYVIDYLIEWMLSLSRSLNRQKKNVEQCRRTNRETPVKSRSPFSAKPIIYQQKD
jgi:hypothetical protein